MRVIKPIGVPVMGVGAGVVQRSNGAPTDFDIKNYRSLQFCSIIILPTFEAISGEAGARETVVNGYTPRQNISVKINISNRHIISIRIVAVLVYPDVKVVKLFTAAWGILVYPIDSIDRDVSIYTRILIIHVPIDLCLESFIEIFIVVC